MTPSEQVPTLDLRRFDTDRDQFVRELGQAYQTYGFCCFVGHGLNQGANKGLVDRAYRAFEAFFSLPDDIKKRYVLPGQAGTRGFTPFRVETAVTATRPDLKEFWHIGRDDVAADSPYAAIMRPNVWPDEVADFKPAGVALYRVLEDLGQTILRAMALDLKLPEHFFEPLTRHGNSVLRALHYPPIRPEDLPAVRAEQHEDISLLTLLVSATESGLELLTRDGRWLPVNPEPGAVIVNVGDMMQRWTNHVYRSTTHRVVNPTGSNAAKPRYSAPFFMDPNPDVALAPIASCVTPDTPQIYQETITAHEYLMERLGQIKMT